VKKFLVESWLPVLLWLVVIFLFSTDAFASGETSKFLVPLLRFFFPFLTANQLEFLHIVARKCGHFSEYFVLALLTYRSVKQVWPAHTQIVVRTLLFIVLAATLDEIHQMFTRFRGPSPVDVGYDCLGAVSALWLIVTYEARRLRTHSVL